MTYDQFVLAAQTAQRAYIASERERIDKLDAAWQAYVKAAHALGLHPLTRVEIQDRQHELGDMERRVPETHGRSPAMRAAWAWESVEKGQSE